MEKIRVLWLADSLAGNAGTEGQVVELSRRLRTRVDLHVATFETSEPRLPADYITFAGFPVNALWGPRGMRQIVRLAAFIRSRNIQVVHGFMPKASLAGAIAGAIAGAPVILTSRRNLGYHYTPRSLMLTRAVNRFVTRIVANSEAARTVAIEREGVHPDKIDVLYNGVDVDKFHPAGLAAEQTELPVPPEARVVGIVANYRPVKNLPLFLRAAAIVAREIPDTWFLLVGTGAMENSLRELAGELGISGRVIFTGGHGRVLPYLHRMSVGCLCSNSEGFSNSILEYMAAGLPVVATDVGGNAEAVQDGRTGFLVKELTPEAFAAPILRLLQDEELRNRMGHMGLQRCRREFDLGHAAERLSQYYEWLLRMPAVRQASAEIAQAHTL